MRFDTILILPYIIIVLLFDVTAVGMVQEVAGFPLNYKAGVQISLILCMQEQNKIKSSK